jgi:hypothetical protein
LAWVVAPPPYEYAVDIFWSRMTYSTPLPSPVDMFQGFQKGFQMFILFFSIRATYKDKITKLKRS